MSGDFIFIFNVSLAQAIGKVRGLGRNRCNDRKFRPVTAMAITIIRMFWGGGGGEEERVKRERERLTNRQTDKQTDGQRERERQTDRERERETHTHTERQRDKDRDRQRQRDRDTETETERHRDTDRDKERRLPCPREVLPPFKPRGKIKDPRECRNTTGLPDSAVSVRHDS